MHFYYLLKEFSSLAEFHHYMNISIVNVSLMKLDDVGMVNLVQNSQLLLKQLHILLNILLQYTLYSVLDLGISNPVGNAN
jgi:hypothetical protein